MAKLIVAGVMHPASSIALAPSEGLMNEQCERMFRAKITPLLTERSLVLVEGMPDWGVVPASSPRYNHILEWTGSALGTVRPRLGSCDPRQTDIGRKAKRRLDIEIEWLVYAEQAFRFSWQPSTMQEARDAILNDRHECEMVIPPTHREIELARHVAAMERRFNRNYRFLMEQFQHRADTCVFIGGTGHALALAKELGCDFEDMAEQKSNVFPAYLAYVACNYCTAKVLEYASK